METPASEKMESVARLSNSVAHDLNNLLMVIRGFTELLSRDLTPEKKALALTEIRKAVERATGLTERLLLLGRPRPLAPVAVDVDAAIRGSADALRAALGGSIALELSLADAAPAVVADAGEIEVLLANLAANARDAMPRGGRFRIATALAAGDAGAAVLLTVADNGEGMSREALAHLYEPYFTTREGRVGAGLGLAMAYGIVRRCGGTIACASSPGAGTEFTIRLPCIDAT
jgi:signal transduction histidine kinase